MSTISAAGSAQRSSSGSSWIARRVSMRRLARGDQLDRDLAIELGIVCHEHRAAATRAEHASQRVPPHADRAIIAEQRARRVGAHDPHHERVDLGARVAQPRTHGIRVRRGAILRGFGLHRPLL
jgi:hypothetical protein